MKRIAAFVVAIATLGAAGANEMFAVRAVVAVRDLASGGGEVASATGKFQDLNIALIATASGSPRVLTEITTSAGDVSLRIASPLLGRVVSPRLKEIEVVADSGVLGTYLYWDIPFGDKIQCKRDGRHINERRTLHLNINVGEAKVERVSIYEPCTP